MTPVGVVFVPPITRAYRYLESRLPGVLVERESEPTGWEPSRPLVVIVSAGGAGAHTCQLMDARLRFDVRAATQREAEELAYRVWELLLGWDEVEDFVYVRSVGPPVWDPEAERRIPAYTMTAVLDFKGRII